MDESRFFEDFVVGEEFSIPSKTITESHFLAFVALSGDNHPLHYDIEYCRAHGWPERIAHGYLVAAQTVLGASALAPLVHDSRPVLLEQSSRFLEPVFVGDTLYPKLSVEELVPKRTAGVVRMRATIRNQRDQLVLDGRHDYLFKKRNPATAD